ncbi:MAG: hypothetical protein PVG51_05675 [Desulfosarcina sp.]|jgi:hypothetical protein
MTDLNPPDAGQRSQLPDPGGEPVHSVTFRSPSAENERPTVRRLEVMRRWILAGVFGVLVLLGGWLLNHLQPHPANLSDGDPREPATEPPTAVEKVSTSQPTSSSEPELPGASVSSSPMVNTTDGATTEAPARDHHAQEPLDLSQAAPQPEPVSKDVEEKAAVVDNRFHDLLSQGLAALHKRQYQDARSTLLKAAAIDPQSDAVKEALIQVDQAMKLTQLDQLRRRATAAEKAGQWPRAHETYLAAMKIDPNVRFAVEGSRRTGRRIAIGKRVEAYLMQPDILFNDRQLNTAVELLLDAEKGRPFDPGLEADLDKLHQLVAIAQTPLRVTLTSDNQTDVSVYKVGRLGRFETQRLDLRPGSYTVVGMRDGYRDVRLRVSVTPSEPPPVIHVVCVESID